MDALLEPLEPLEPLDPLESPDPLEPPVPRTQVLSVAQVRELEQSIEAQGTSLLELMKRAGRSVSDHVMTISAPSQPVVIFSGSGNNGGDGWVVAGDLSAQGYPVVLVTPRDAESLTAEPAKTAALEVIEAFEEHAALEATVALGEHAAFEELAAPAPPLEILCKPSAKELAAALGSAAVVVDAMLGIGFDGGNMKEPYAGWIDAINAARATRKDLHVVAVDVPSGLSAQTGSTARPTVIADTTITMLALKPGLVAEGAKQYCGEVRVAALC